MGKKRQTFNPAAPAPIIPTEVFVELNPELQEFEATNFPQFIGPPKIVSPSAKTVGTPSVYPYLPGSYPYYAAGVTPTIHQPYYPIGYPTAGVTYPGYSYGAYPYSYYGGFKPLYLPWNYKLYYQLWNSPNYQLMGYYPQYRPRPRPRRWCIPRPCFPL